MNTTSAPLADDEVLALVRRMELLPQLVRRQQEEAIINCVDLPQDWIDAQRQELLGDQDLEAYLRAKGWHSTDLDLQLCRAEALRRFASQLFGPGLEEAFLACQGSRDEVIYSLLRVSDAALAHELWIRLEEQETTFAEVASQFGEGPEAQRKGVMGPMEIGRLQPPELATSLRSLRPGQLSPPQQFGQWQILLRLEQLTPARFDQVTRERLLQEKLDQLLEDRVQRYLRGEPLDPLNYDRPA
ncbi:peptidylprolyl isomerase [Cyanobium sp. WAJ14-Wanaka]|uniref:peptidylprolyl isomerase n=1 Tax=Cyanobium sp. WAJ14-Wanaka TaxID=2823725 RepID=UPI0020CEAF11|nr:peptidylprolyl isomerase [Cyanobium sp. WAJ14-Wanaka]MCP9775648.1 peptidylprolyl isomerase [Cyanobium sp. WAJ14-Wanaka]